jgi:hypothetical protein
VTRVTCHASTHLYNSRRIAAVLGAQTIIPTVSAMPKVQVHELRRLLLPVETAVDAVIELDREHGGMLSRSALLEVQVDTGAEPGLVIVFQPAGSEERVRRRFSQAAIAAAIINYCWKARIPLPRNGTKRIDVVPDGFAMTIEATVELLRKHGPLPSGGVTSVTTHTPGPDAPNAPASPNPPASAESPETAVVDGAAAAAEPAPS